MSKIDAIKNSVEELRDNLKEEQHKIPDLKWLIDAIFSLASKAAEFVDKHDILIPEIAIRKGDIEIRVSITKVSVKK